MARSGGERPLGSGALGVAERSGHCAMSGAESGFTWTPGVPRGLNRVARDLSAQL